MSAEEIALLKHIIDNGVLVRTEGKFSINGYGLSHLVGPFESLLASGHIEPVINIDDREYFRVSRKGRDAISEK